MGVEVMTGQRKFEKKADDNGLEYFFSGVREILEKDDLTIGNLEGPLSSSKSHRKGRQFIFRGKPEYATALALGSIEAVTIANNHAKDLLERGRADTKKALDDAGVTWFGYDDTAIYEVMGVKIGLIGLTEWDYSQKRICGAVKALRQKCDAVILYMHWGLERRLKPTQAQKRLGRAAIDAGADMVLGSHSHVVGGIELYKDRPIVYGLANFCFSGNTNPSDKDTFIFTQSFIIDKRAGTVAMGDTNIIPCSVSSSQSENDFKPTPLSDKRALKVLEKIRKASKGFENTLDFAKLTDEISQRE